MISSLFGFCFFLFFEQTIQSASPTKVTLFIYLKSSLFNAYTHKTTSELLLLRGIYQLLLPYMSTTIDPDDHAGIHSYFHSTSVKLTQNFQTNATWFPLMPSHILFWNSMLVFIDLFCLVWWFQSQLGINRTVYSYDQIMSM